MEIREEDKIDLSKYFGAALRACRKLKKYLLAVLLVCIAVSGLKTALFFHTTYSAQAMFIAHTAKQESSLAAQAQDEDFLNTFNSILSGPMMREVVTEQLGLDPALPFPAQIRLAPIAETSLIRLVVTAEDPATAYQVADCILKYYNYVTQQVISDARLTVVDTPVQAKQPDAAPDYLGSLVKGGVEGLLLCAVLVLVYSLLNRTVVDSDDIRDRLHLTMLAKVIHHPDRGQGPEALFLTNPHVNYGVRKSFYDVFAALEKKHREDSSKVFLVTSPMPDGGRCSGPPWSCPRRAWGW